jgi:hypothetical protein
MNKTTFIAILAAISLIGLVAAKIGSIDTECQANGFDYGIAKFEASNGGYVLSEGISGDFDIEVTGDSMHASWTSVPAVDGVLMKSGTETTVLTGGESGDVYGLETTNAKGKPIVQEISHITFCGYVPVPEFSTMAAGVAMTFAIGGYFLLRR